MRLTSGGTKPDDGARWREAYDMGAGVVVVLVHVAVMAASLAGPALILADTFHNDAGLTLSAWRHVFGDWQRWVVLLSNTAVACAIAVGLCGLIGTALAMVLFKTDVRFRLAAVALLLLCAAIPLHVVNGSVLSIVGIERARGSPGMVGVIHAVAHLPIVVLIVGAALRSVAADLEEAALVEGAGQVRVILLVTLRCAIGGVVASVILVVLWVTTDYSISDVLLVRTFAEEVYTQYALQGRPQEPALVCLPQMVLFGGLLWALRRGYLTGDGVPLTSGRRHCYTAGRWRVPLSGAAGVVVVTLAVTPLASLGARLTRAGDLARVAWSFNPEIRVSVLASLAAGLIAASLGVGLAWYIARRRKWRTIATAYVIVMLAVPAPVLGMGMIRLFNRPGLAGGIYDSPAILVAAYVFRFLPIAVILLIPAVRAIPIECELAARVDGCSQLGVWRRIVWPQCGPMALVAMFVVMVLSVGELPCSLLVTPPGYATAGARFFSLIHYGMYPDAAMLCLLSIGCVLLPWLGLLVLLKRRLLD